MNSIPICGFGTYCLKNDVGYNCTLYALNNGYNHIDTASLYQNETVIGKAILDSGIDRNKIWITTKINMHDIASGKDKMHNSVLNSLKNLNTDYIDLVLLHGPVDNVISESWAILEDIMLEMKGKIRFIGVSNYDVRHLNIILSNCRIKPYANQFEISPYLNRDELVKLCNDNDIIIVAHTSLTKNKKFNDLKLENLSVKTDISKPLILLAWALQHNMVVLPRSSNFEHIKENLECLNVKLNDDVMNELDNFHVNDCFRIYRQFT